MKSIVSAGFNKNASVKSTPQEHPQIRGCCLEIQFLNPPIFPPNPWHRMNTATIQKVSILISGRASVNSVVSQCASKPTNDFNDLHINPVSSTLKTNHVMKMKYCVINHPKITITFGIEEKRFLINFNRIKKRCINKRTPCIAPQSTKFHDAPCHKPPSNMVPIRATMSTRVPPRLPPRGM